MDCEANNKVGGGQRWGQLVGSVWNGWERSLSAADPACAPTLSPAAPQAQPDSAHLAEMKAWGLPHGPWAP